MGEAVERGDCCDARLLVGMQQRAMGRVEPELGKQRCRRPAVGLLAVSFQSGSATNLVRTGHHNGDRLGNRREEVCAPKMLSLQAIQQVR
jgi:hypothetical protein